MHFGFKWTFRLSNSSFTPLLHLHFHVFLKRVNRIISLAAFMSTRSVMASCSRLIIADAIMFVSSQFPSASQLVSEELATVPLSFE